jgi:hypothetical protein
MEYRNEAINSTNASYDQEELRDSIEVYLRKKNEKKHYIKRNHHIWDKE